MSLMQGSPVTGAQTGHSYVSTACFHTQHGACRNTCKFCGTSCSCSCHPDGAQSVMSWVDQARDVARELLLALRDVPGQIPIELLDRVLHDRNLFWLRGEEQPPGIWRGDAG
jgi:hypothetical protein